MNLLGADSNKKRINHNYLTIDKADDIFVNQDGDSMTGNIDMKNNKIVNLQNPTDDNDAVNKSYLIKQKHQYDLLINDVHMKLDLLFLSKADKPQEWTHRYILDFGSSDKSFKSLTREIPMPILKELATKLNLTVIKSSQIHLQITSVLGEEYHDQIIMNIQSYKIFTDKIQISVNAFRTTNEGWGLHLHGHLTITICEKELLIL